MDVPEQCERCGVSLLGRNYAEGPNGLTMCERCYSYCEAEETPQQHFEERRRVAREYGPYSPTWGRP